MSDKELFQTITLWLEIERKTQERIAAIRRELSELGAVERTKLDELQVILY